MKFMSFYSQGSHWRRGPRLKAVPERKARSLSSFLVKLSQQFRDSRLGSKQRGMSTGIQGSLAPQRG